MKEKTIWKKGIAVLFLLAVGCSAPYRIPKITEPAVRVSIDADASQKAGVLDHAWEVVTGSGNASLYIRPGWGEKTLAHLSDVHKNLGIRMVRFHGIFLDKVGIYQGPGSYDFSGLDRVYDGILATGVKPFIELSFMPEKLATKKSVGFPLGYRPFISPPQSYEEWGKMIEAFTRHLVERYGLGEVKTWYFEVWNEPDLSVFWTGKMKDYFHLYDVTVKAVKSVSPELQVGGPASSQSTWILEFLNHCKETQAPLDFVSTHGYYNDTLSRLMPQVKKAVPEAEKNMIGKSFHDEVYLVDQIIAKIFPKPLPLFITEWNSSVAYSYSMTMWPNDHDLPNDAAFMAKAIKEANGYTASFSHWTYSDVFEEWGLPGSHWPVKTAAYHGGFGLITIDGIHKPAYHAFAFLHKMGKNLVKTEVKSPKSEIDALATLDSDQLAMIAWYWVDTLSKQETSAPAAMTTLRIKNLPASLVGKNLRGYRIDQDHGNTFPEWLKMGKPGNLSAEQIKALKKLSDDTIRAPELDRRVDGPDLTIEFKLPPAGVVFLTSE